MNIIEVIRINRDRLLTAMGLNTRAGKAVFKIQTQSELAQWIVDKTKGARCVSELTDLDALILPELDKELVVKIETENPTTIDVLGMTVTVTYSEFSDMPKVRLHLSANAANEVRSLPREGIFLPSGREVGISSSIEGYWEHVEAPSSGFVKKVFDFLNQKKWQYFEASGRNPDLFVPDVYSADPFPTVHEHQYGICAETGMPLIAFGALTYMPPGIWSSEKFGTKWFTIREEAEVEHEKARTAFESKRVVRPSSSDVAETTRSVFVPPMSRLAEARRQAEDLQILHAQKLLRARRMSAQDRENTGSGRKTGMGSLSDAFGDLGL